MNWKEQLVKYFNEKKWEESITLMRQTILHNPVDMDAYLNLMYLLMDILVEEEYEIDNLETYKELLLRYYNESYYKFESNPEFLFFLAKITTLSFWYFNFNSEEEEYLLYKKAYFLENDNLLYKWGYYGIGSDNEDNNIIFNKVKEEIRNLPQIIEYLKTKSILGEYLIEILE